MQKINRKSRSNIKSKQVNNQFGCAGIPGHFLCLCMHMAIHRCPQCGWLTLLPSLFRWFLPFWAWWQLQRENLPSNLLTLLMSCVTIFIRYLNSFHTSVLSSWGYRGRLKHSQWKFFLQKKTKPLKHCLRSCISLLAFVTTGTSCHNVMIIVTESCEVQSLRGKSNKFCTVILTVLLRWSPS